MRGNSQANSVAEKPGYSKLLLPALGLSVLSTWLITVTFQLLLIDIAQAFEVPVGTASMVASVGSISGVVFGLLMAFVSTRFNHKSLLLAGLGCTGVAAVGFFFAPNFFWIMIPNVAVGAGIAIVTAMSYSIIGEVLPLPKRGRAIGVVVAALTLAYVVGAPTIGVIAEVAGWRSVMTLLSLPFTLVSILLAVVAIPNKPPAQPLEEKEPFFEGCKQAFSTTPTVAALLVTMFMLCESAISYYSVAYFRETFGVTIMWGSTFVLVGNILAAIGGFAAGLLVNRVGRKRLGTVTLALAAALTVSFVLMPTVELSGTLSIIRFFISAMTFTAGGSLIIEQMPKYRSTMTSLNAAFMNVGMLLASLTAGFMLNSYSYQMVGITLGAFGIIGAIIWVTLVKEPVKT